jgi:Tfp pilus assembly protein PilF
MKAKHQEVSLENAFDLALIHMQQSNYRVAEMVFRDILKSCPDHYESYYFLSLARYYIGDRKDALTLIEKAVQSKEAEAEWWCNYAIMLNDDERYEEALKAYGKAIVLDKKYPILIGIARIRFG